MNGRQHTSLDKIEASVRNGDTSLTYGIFAAFALGKAAGEMVEDDTGPRAKPESCDCRCCEPCRRGHVPAQTPSLLQRIFGRRNLREAMMNSLLLEKVREIESVIATVSEPGLCMVYAPSNDRLAFTSPFPARLVISEGLQQRLADALRNELVAALSECLTEAKKQALAEAKAVIAELEPPDAG